MGKTLRRLSIIFLALLAAGNILAWNNAKGMLEFSQEGKRTGHPNSLSLLEKIHVVLFGVTIPKPRNMSTPADFGLDFKTYRFPNGLHDSLEAWYIPRKRPKATVILFHGYCGSKSQLLPLAREFHNLGCSTFLVDFYGSGGSSGDSTSVGYFEAKDVVASYGVVKGNWPALPVVLYGYSMGGAALLRAVSVHGMRADALILESVFAEMLGAARNRIQSLGLPDVFASELFVFWGGIQNGFNGFRHNPSEYAHDVTCPILILHGQQDERVKKGDATTLFNNVKGRKRLVLFLSSGHELKLGNNRALWCKSVKRFLNDLLRDNHPGS
jgi:alpha-beta hydrolase superfamily lysophospholipase